MRFTTLGPGLQVAGLAVALTVIDVLGPDGVAPFIYFRFVIRTFDDATTSA